MNQKDNGLKLTTQLRRQF